VISRISLRQSTCQSVHGTSPLPLKPTREGQELGQGPFSYIINRRQLGLRPSSLRIIHKPAYRSTFTMDKEYKAADVLHDEAINIPQHLDDETGLSSVRRAQVEKRLKLKLDLRFSILIVIYILNYM
jgi:hypothetical protein